MRSDARTDGGMAAKRGGSSQQRPSDSRTATERARDAVEEFVAEYVGDSRYANAPMIAKQVSVDARAQNVSQVINEKSTGCAPDGFLDDVRIGRWSDGTPTTWYFDRIGGEPAPERLMARKGKVDIVLEISDATGAEGAEKYTEDRDRPSTKISMPLTWMHDVLDAVCEVTEYDPELGDEDDDRDRREQLGDLSRDECSAVLERAVDDVTITGMSDHWNKETCAAIHELVVGDGGDDGE